MTRISIRRRAVRAFFLPAFLALAACAPTARTVAREEIHTQTHETAGSSGTLTAQSTQSMEQLEEDAAKAFPAKTEGVGG